MVFIARGEHLDAIRSRGLRIETPGGELVIHPSLATDDPAEAGIVDGVLVGGRLGHSAPDDGVPAGFVEVSPGAHRAPT
jgi:2-dehydropantoate 2-reductase